MGEGEHRCIMEERVRALETGQAETRIYVKEIREDIQEIKTDIKKAAQQNNESSWQPIVVKLIEVLGTAFTVLASIFGAVKLMGKG
ncbi:hypothetical protein [Clostridium thermosuccinogenes]|uniref:hypothetical protein n=1 Tax=Clostridium thermosuccinogenes TaxID=84032 RepID=UPI000CCC9781|nr:hypothetical protein [Pseudoclostridium thermosuccinogenes]NLH00501.1 hypothetical protein [Clostridiales bacterium]PNT91302.1 hypothetical protein CDQ83_16000 [Pseudoclostridium thermosuccinogenes]